MPRGQELNDVSNVLADLARVHQAQDLEIHCFLQLVRRIEADMNAINTHLAAFTARMRAMPKQGQKSLVLRAER